MKGKVLGLFSVCAALIIAGLLVTPMSTVLNAVGTASAADVPKETMLRIGFMQKIDSLNPYVGVSDAAYVFYGLVYDPLDNIDDKLNPIPNIATGIWAVPTTDSFMTQNNLPFGSVWQYNLTDKAMFSDGQPVTADDVVWNMDLNAHHFTDLWAFQPYAYYMNYSFKVDDKTVRIVFYDRATKQPMPASYAYLLSIYILPRHKMKDMTSATIGYKWTGVFPGEDMPIVGTGPFMATPTLYNDWLAGNPVTLVKNPNYHWGVEYNKTIHFDKIQLRFFDDTLAMQYALTNNELDVAAFPPQTYYDLKKQVVAGDLKNIQTYDGPKVTQYWTEIGICDKPNGKNPSRLDPVVRHAMAMATNKTYIVENFYMGLADVGTTMIPPINTYWHYEPTAAEKWPFDFAAANALLESNGYSDTDADNIRECTASSPAVTSGYVAAGTELKYEMLLRAEFPEEVEIGKWLKTQWNNIGVDFDYTVVDEPTLNTIVYSYEYDLMIWYWSADIDPNYQLYEATSQSIMGWNDIYYHSRAYDDNFTMSVKTMDKVQRKEFTDNCQKIMYKDCNYIIFAYPYQTYAWRTDTFSGWGDWSANPGRSVDNFWGGNPLWFDLMPLAIEKNGPNWTLIAIGGVAAAAVIAAVVLLTLRRRKGKGEKDDSSSPLGD